LNGSLVPVLSAIAAKHGTTPTAVLLSWAIRQNFVLTVTIVSSTVMIEEYLQAFAIKLTPDEQDEITQARRGYR
jgi:diketogulonate reductase-like aldo/keto reductase